MDEDIINLVVARLETMPSHIEVHFGGDKGYDREMLIDSVKKQNSLGKKIVETELAYLKMLKTF
jgi:hypothetical protein